MNALLLLVPLALLPVWAQHISDFLPFQWSFSFPIEALIGKHTVNTVPPKTLAAYRDRGVSIADPHTVTLEDGAGHKRVDTDQLSFKRTHDPHGLLNPGKMRTFQTTD